MDRLVNDAKLKEEEGLCNDPFKLHQGSNGHLTMPSIDLKAMTTDFSGQTVDKGISLGPNTPTPDRENMDIVCGAKAPSSFVSSSSPSVYCLNSPSVGLFAAEAEAEVDTSQDGSPSTPREGVFDPFSPGLADMALAPLCKKLVKESWKIIARRLNFDDSDVSLGHRNQDSDVETLSEEIILEHAYQTFLEAVVVKQTDETFIAKNPPSSCIVPVKTPPDMKFNGTADACPAAPVKKVASKSPDIDTVRRKLEF